MMGRRQKVKGFLEFKMLCKYCRRSSARKSWKDVKQGMNRRERRAFKQRLRNLSDV